MEIRITVSEDAGRCAGEKAEAVGISPDQAIAVSVQRIADGTETLENDLLPDGTRMRRTLRQQIYRVGAQAQVASRSMPELRSLRTGMGRISRTDTGI
jgi:hypothetical protein